MLQNSLKLDSRESIVDYHCVLSEEYNQLIAAAHKAQHTEEEMTALSKCQLPILESQ
jgi:hypothetical protein